ncbi:hypothetical protein CLV84_1465 [Neolewinella xylanilytica]|uniref:DUF1648 domain-containing protein n=1 Tax=Neolewinella xylanilytica TaxID=1514080 RepID=A0A2S6IAG5_9BACT|nr:hypothetical protein [Neolewinella xylanilytica]PPK88497.1 hypothetical protein CLV84_1465 [Neolewinella xylanilytica]
MPRPKIHLPKSAADYWLELGSLASLLLLVFVSFSGFVRVPTTIPFRFGMDGWPDLYPSRIRFGLLPFLGVVVYAVGQLLTLRPHRFSYPARITPANAAVHYRNAIRLLQFVLAWLLLSMSYLQFRTARAEAGLYGGPSLLVAILLLVLLVSGGWYFLRPLLATSQRMIVNRA